jgi:methylglutaconyl-CoA hydratase
LVSASNDLAASVLTGAPQALAATKKLLRACAGDGLREQMQLAMRVSSEARRTPEAREGLSAFLENRGPTWLPGSEPPTSR